MSLLYTALLLVSGMADNLPLGGGLATGGIIGMFVGATLLALAWQIIAAG